MSFVEMKQNNNIRPEGTPCLLIHGFDAEQIIIIKGLAMTLDIIDVRVVETSMQDNCIQDIIDNNIKRNAMVKPISEQVIIFNDLSEHDIHKFIGDYKKTGISRPIYAAGTPTSRTWTFKAWLEELMEERAAIAEQQKLQAMMKDGDAAN
ncbi:MAG: DUF3783 domain-containing protein [Vallitaleaceae bacterium]|jgi:hypothetical protein|nr:DUF3783 domain-containing protein [Vallitaleaceae bacterium]